LSDLNERTLAVAGDAQRLVRSSDGPLRPRSPGVAELFVRADDAARVGASLAAGDGWRELSLEQQTAGRRVIATALHSARTATQLLGTGRQLHAESTTSVTDPSSPASTRMWNEIRAGRDLPNVRIVGNLPRDAAAGVAELFSQLPRRVVQQLDAQGCRSTLFSGRLTDVWGYRSLRGVHPRGWPEGKTWDVVPGAGGGHRMAADPSRDHKGMGHGTDSLALHELGHVVDEVLAAPAYETVTSDPAWLTGPQAEVRADPSATDYVRTYPEEWFAEALVAYTRTPDSNRALQVRCPRTAGFLESTLGMPRFPSSRT
jgi:hypothetical protein